MPLSAYHHEDELEIQDGDQSIEAAVRELEQWWQNTCENPANRPRRMADAPAFSSITGQGSHGDPL